jgi:hypothetical protein
MPSPIDPDEILRRFEERQKAGLEPEDPDKVIHFPAGGAAAAEGQDGQKTAPGGRFPAGFKIWDNSGIPNYFSGGKKPWFSLAAIMGNEEHHIERFIRTFEPIFDEIVLVRAIGNREPDATFEIAASIATKPLLLA